MTVQLSDGSSVTADELLVAVGRTPATRGLGVQEVGGELDDAGYVRVTERMEVEGVLGVTSPGCMPWGTSTVEPSSRTWASTRPGPSGT